MHYQRKSAAKKKKEDATVGERWRSAKKFFHRQIQHMCNGAIAFSFLEAYFYLYIYDFRPLFLRGK